MEVFPADEWFWCLWKRLSALTKSWLCLPFFQLAGCVSVYMYIKCVLGYSCEFWTCWHLVWVRVRACETDRKIRVW